MMMRHPEGRPRGARILKFAIVGAAAAIVFALVFGLAVQALWNWVLPSVFGVGRITYAQAFGILLLARILFGGVRVRGPRGGGWGRHRWHRPFGPDRWGPDDFDRFREYWKTEGRDAFRAYVDRQAGTPAD